MVANKIICLYKTNNLKKKVCLHYRGVSVQSKLKTVKRNKRSNLTKPKKAPSPSANVKIQTEVHHVNLVILLLCFP